MTADAKRKSEMSQITVEQLGELIAQAKAGRVTRENLQRFLLNLDGGTGYTVSVDYGKTIEEMVSAGRYDWYDDSITSANFLVVGTGVATIAIELVHLNKVVSSKEALAYMEANGLRPATIEEQLAFGATYPEVQREFPVVGLGSSWVYRNGVRHAPCLYGYGSYRKLDLYWYDDDWSESYRFLAVRK
ncbi:hypothetical protein KJ673_00955 [Patescibacteria group bacterium]|nr:hypothetical protein [Patescibacteria group bacterium]MBU4453390.1 hypothetical protein [Patescibacteria group bacterium]MCG2687540.1 hypothetical protein [Candidatus Parcubacteria bacterium]